MDRYYFGYGSNMSSWVMSELCLEFDVVGIARLPDHKLTFTRYSVGWRGGVSDVVYSPGDEVWGVLYAIADKCHDALDQKENYGRGYTSMGCDVVLSDGTPYHAITYIVIEKAPEEIPPSKEYHETIIEGAKEAKLPKAYIDGVLKKIKTSSRR